jgi:hypothetical protein
MLSTEALEEFKKLYKDKYETQLNNKDALEYGTRLIGFVKAVYGNDLGRISFDTEVHKRDN